MNQTKRVIACIIVRMKSVRLKEKALADLNGSPMTLQLIRRLKESKTISDIVICTSTHSDDQILKEKAKEWGVGFFAGHEEDVLSRLIGASEEYNGDLILRVTGDNPFTDAVNIDRMVEHHINRNAEYTRTARLALGVTAEVMSKEMLKKLHSHMPDPCQSEYMSFYSFDPDFFHCEVLSPFNFEDRAFYSLTIDYPEDLELARKIYKKLSPDNKVVPQLKDVIDLLDKDPNYKQVDKSTKIKLPDDKTMSYEELINMLDELGLKSKKVNISLKR